MVLLHPRPSVTQLTHHLMHREVGRGTDDRYCRMTSHPLKTPWYLVRAVAESPGDCAPAVQISEDSECRGTAHSSQQQPDICPATLTSVAGTRSRHMWAPETGPELWARGILQTANTDQ